MEQSLEQICQMVKGAAPDTQKLVVSLAMPEVLMLPSGFTADGVNLLKAVFPGQIGQPQLWANGKKFAFSVPPTVPEVLQRHFSEVQILPSIAALPNAADENSAIHLFFVDHQFRVAVYKKGQLQLAQQYHFSAPLDVVYYLLKICAGFGLSQQETPLLVSGFIDESSALYKEIYQYFLNIRFHGAEPVEMDGQAVPQYYFSSLYNLAQCAL